MPHLNQNLLPHCTLANTSSDYVGVVIQEDIAVTSGLLRGDRAAYFDPGKPYAGYQRKFHYPYPRVTHIFCSAYDMKGAGPRPTPGHRAFAKVVLNGMYEGTIKAAYKRNIPNVVLTMLGGGSFRNRIDWIGHAIENHVAPFVQRYGMRVDLVFHPDKPRRGAVRNTRDDAAFLMRMIQIADGINRTQNARDGNVQRHVHQYLDAHYSGNGQAASVAARWLTQHVRF